MQSVPASRNSLASTYTLARLWPVNKTLVPCRTWLGFSLWMRSALFQCELSSVENNSASIRDSVAEKCRLAQTVVAMAFDPFQRRTRVPKFGSWDSSEGTHFTEVFEDARLNKGKPMNPNDPLQNPMGFPPPRSRPTSIDASENEPRKPHSRRSSKENADAFSERRVIEPPAQRAQVDNTRYVPPPGTVTKSSSENTRRVGPQEEETNPQHKSPIHHHARHANSRGNASPSWERRPSTEGSATPGRSRLRNSNSNTDPAEKSPALPKFGAWDANDPASGDGFTVIFNNARNEKKAGGAAHVPPLGFDGRNDKDLYPGKGPHSKSSSKLFCCFQPTVTEA